MGVRILFSRQPYICPPLPSTEPRAVDQVLLLGPLGFDVAQHRRTPRPSVERIRRTALRPGLLPAKFVRGKILFICLEEDCVQVNRQPQDPNSHQISELTHMLGLKCFEPL